jgi:hypothetical protein
MGRRLSPNSDAWGGAWGSASAWGGSWGWSWGPLHEVEEELTVGGGGDGPEANSIYDRLMEIKKQSEKDALKIRRLEEEELIMSIVQFVILEN